MKTIINIVGAWTCVSLLAMWALARIGERLNATPSEEEGRVR